MLKLFDKNKERQMVLSMYYSKGGILTFELWDKDSKESQKVRVWGNSCPGIKETLVNCIKKLNEGDLQHTVVEDINDRDKHLHIFCGKGALAFRIGTMKFIERDIRNIASITEYIGEWSIASIANDGLMEFNFKLDKIMEKLGISTQKPKLFGKPTLSVVREDDSASFAGLNNLINAILEGEKPNGNDNSNIDKTDSTPATDYKQDEDIEE